jgi:mRNA interferase RelE/StbE
VRLARGAEKDIDRLDPAVRKRVLRALRRLAEGPGEGALVKLKGRPGLRMRVGDWRVIVELEQEARTIRVKRVLPRGRAYKR